MPSEEDGFARAKSSIAVLSCSLKSDASFSCCFTRSWSVSSRESRDAAPPAPALALRSSACASCVHDTCMYVCMYVHVYVCEYVYICMYVCIFIYIYI